MGSSEQRKVVLKNGENITSCTGATETNNFPQKFTIGNKAFHRDDSNNS